MSSSVANAQHLQMMDLHLRESDINFLQSILPCLASSQSLQELAVVCDASGVFSGCATHTLAYVHSYTHTNTTRLNIPHLSHAYKVSVCMQF